MNFLTRRSILMAALAVVGLALLAPAAQAQYRVRYGRAFPSAQSIYPSFVPTQLQRSQFYWGNYQARVVGRTLSTYPPWAFGYNPYPAVVNYGPVYPTPVYTPPYTYNPYPVNPYLGYGTATVSPYGVP